MKSAKQMLDLLKGLEERFDSEPAVIIDDSERILFVGDTHGDFKSAEIVAKLSKDHQKIICLGDYVDRGARGCDVVEEFAKNKYILLPGNHDACYQVSPRDFKEELKKFAPEDYWEILNKYILVFQKAPIAYFNTRYKLLAIHGFIPHEEKNWDIKRWKKAKDCEKDYPIVPPEYELLWNDPSPYHRGIHESRRGDGIWGIGADIIEKFMEKNDLNYIVRSHQPKENLIFQIGSRKLVNIGSAGYYGTRGFFSLPDGKIILREDDLKYFIS